MKQEIVEYLVFLLEKGVGRKEIWQRMKRTDSSLGKDLGVKNIKLGLDCLDTGITRYNSLGINIVTFWDRCYPKMLRVIPDPPLALFVKGKFPLKERDLIGVVGSRAMSVRGKRAVDRIVPELVSAGLGIVSGLARGVDSQAHKACLRKKGFAVGVLPCALDTVYPRENKILEDRIIRQGGCIISEYPLGSKIERKNFLERNRVIAGVSRGVLVVEAAARSGSISTPNFALDQGRDVWCVPASKGEPNSEGILDLLEDGACPIQGADEILTWL
ncbi:DNA-protecting protein DprA [Candidatus Collierbacteria bacterium]|nr:DNA-protecting protein DprA [Candidatus Collierbacteria bacterium]